MVLKSCFQWLHKPHEHLIVKYKDKDLGKAHAHIAAKMRAVADEGTAVHRMEHVLDSKASDSIHMSVDETRSGEPVPPTMPPTLTPLQIQGHGAAGESPSTDEVHSPSQQPQTPERQQQKATSTVADDVEEMGCILHVRGVGGELEDSKKLTKIFATFGNVVHVAVRPRIDQQTGANTSWALVTMETKLAADRALTGAASVAQDVASGSKLSVTRFSKERADSSKGQMVKLRKEATAFRARQSTIVRHQIARTESDVQADSEAVRANLDLLHDKSQRRLQARLSAKGARMPRPPQEQPMSPVSQLPARGRARMSTMVRHVEADLESDMETNQIKVAQMVETQRGVCLCTIDIIAGSVVRAASSLSYWLCRACKATFSCTTGGPTASPFTPP